MILVGCGVINPFGDFEPSGPEFHLPAGISDTAITPSTSEFSPLGSFTLEFTACCTTATRLTPTLPAGLILVSPRSDVQHLILAKDQVVTALPGRDTTVILGTFSCNERRKSGSPGDHYRIGPTTDNVELQRIIGITRHKDLAASPGNLGLVQEAIWSVTDGSGLTSEQLDKLNALPEG